jgi:hypothetical protein
MALTILSPFPCFLPLYTKAIPLSALKSAGDFAGPVKTVLDERFPAMGKALGDSRPRRGSAIII